ncbi:MAG: PA2779 family protein [Bacteroidota bacterium]
MQQTIFKSICIFTVFSFLLLNISIQTSMAQMITTETSIEINKQAEDRTMVNTFLQREDVQQTMARQGIDLVEAQKRVDNLSDAEVLRLAQTIEQLPAGAGALGTIVGASVFVFIVLLVTDLLGLTNVFPFVN